MFENFYETMDIPDISPNAPVVILWYYAFHLDLKDPKALLRSYIYYLTHISPYGVWYKAVFGDGVFGYSTPPIFSLRSNDTISSYCRRTLHQDIVKVVYN